MKCNASSLKLGCLNIEKYEHLDERVIPALREADLDVICLQEVPEDKVSYLESALGATSLFLGTTFPFCSESNIRQVFGLAILLRRATVVRCNTHVYHESTPDDVPAPENRALLYAVIEKDGVHYSIGNTHFTWTHDGDVTEQQFVDLAALLGVIDDHVGERLILCGDFNAARGKDIWGMLARRYRDNIPRWVATTLDQTYHRAAPLFLVVDGMFTSQHYEASGVEVKDGVSDHMFITGKVACVA